MSDNFAIIATGGKQYKVSSGSKIKIETLETSSGSVVFDKVLLRSTNGAVEIGTPHLASAKVKGNILGNGRGEKKIILKYHSKTRQHRKKGHRQDFAEVEIVSL
jgi:large subunit ribosomal protein L21